MFNILKYNHDLVSDSIEIRVLFQLKPTAEIHNDGGHFAKKASGDAWLRQLKQNYLTIKVENFLHHKKHIIESSPGHKSLCNKKNSLDELFRFLTFACTNPSLPEVCKWCITMHKHFEIILPSVTNPRYQSSIDALNEIMEFAKLHVNGALIKKAS
jgi:hypothetical protein